MNICSVGVRSHGPRMVDKSTGYIGGWTSHQNVFSLYLKLPLEILLLVKREYCYNNIAAGSSLLLLRYRKYDGRLILKISPETERENNIIITIT